MPQVLNGESNKVMHNRQIKESDFILKKPLSLDFYPLYSEPVISIANVAPTSGSSDTWCQWYLFIQLYLLIHWSPV